MTAILNYTTKIDHWKSISEIQEKLGRAGAGRIIVDQENGIPKAVTFSLVWNDQPVFFAVPCNFQGVLRSMEKNKKVPRAQCNEEQALRVGWRIVKDWIEAQLAIVEAEVCTLPEVFLPYAITNMGNTVFQMVELNKSMLALPQGGK